MFQSPHVLSQETELKINETSEFYRPTGARGSLLFFQLMSLCRATEIFFRGGPLGVGWERCWHGKKNTATNWLPHLLGGKMVMNHELLLNGGFFWKHMVRFFRVEDQLLPSTRKNSSQIDHRQAAFISRELPAEGFSNQQQPAVCLVYPLVN